ncbi:MULTISPECIES: alpha/beta fold hydrolase [unclassified Mesorhizobium]|uniref:alpha/beta fold hydrolase n=1 Tax=unclassified Mesorhizobium TaxID=325217 RepID=UPI0003F5E98B|nr:MULTISPECIES: alpha/beta hydrolase [unclassified Mesorhizobium]WJI53387.1 alpha/beta hydrolase [Mesorhizobium sp. C089B]
MKTFSTVSRRAFLLASLSSAMLLPGIASSKTREMTMKTSTIAGPQGQLAGYDIKSGGGLPILFAHGDCSRATQWNRVMQLTAGGREEAVAFDFRGHGASAPAADANYGYDGRADDIGAVADAFGLQRFVLVAHSGGSGAALAYAASHADRVAGILLVDPATDPRALPKEIRDGFVRDLAGPQGLDVLKAYYTSIAGSDEAVRQTVLADAAVVDPAARAGVGKALAEWNPEPTLHAYHGPIFVLATEANDNAAALFRLRIGIGHRTVAGSGHWVMLDKPEAVAEAVNTFVSTIEAGQK